jgi:hypothetical protein
MNLKNKSPRRKKLPILNPKKKLSMIISELLPKLANKIKHFSLKPEPEAGKPAWGGMPMARRL